MKRLAKTFLFYAAIMVAVVLLLGHFNLGEPASVPSEIKKAMKGFEFKVGDKIQVKGQRGQWLDAEIIKDWDPINSWLLDLRFLGIATILLHHTGKGGGQRGTSAREDNIDNSLVLKQPHDYVPEDGARFITRFQKARVRTEDLPAIADTMFQLTEDQNGRLVWSYGSVKRENRLEILRLLDEGQDQKTVGEVVGVDKGYVSRIRKQAIKDGHLTSKNKLSQTGYSLVHGDMEDS